MGLGRQTMNIRLLATALMLAGTTASCTDKEIQTALDNLEGQQTEADTHIQTLTDQVNNLAEIEHEAADTLSSSSSAPPQAAISSDPSSEECITILRVQTCDGGTLHHLGPDGSWID